MKRAFIIAITGTPGTGKTTLAKELFRYLSYDFKVKLISQDELIRKTNSVVDFDSIRKSNIIDESKLSDNFDIAFKNEMITYDVIIIDSHLSHLIKGVDLVIVTKSSLSELEKRLKKRKYSLKKIQENLMAELMNTCGNESEAIHETIYFSLNKEIAEIFDGVNKINDLINMIKERVKSHMFKE